MYSIALTCRSETHHHMCQVRGMLHDSTAQQEIAHIPATCSHCNNSPVEVVVLLLSDCGLLHGPDGLHRVHRLAVHLHGESHEGAVLFDDAVRQ
jgi:hypothetical protein